MKKIEVDVEFIKRAHANACNEWQGKIEDQLPELFPNGLTLLIEEAKRRGLIGGVTVQTTWCKVPFTIAEESYNRDGLGTLSCRAINDTGIFTLYDGTTWAVPGISRVKAEERLGLKIIG